MMGHFKVTGHKLLVGKGRLQVHVLLGDLTPGEGHKIRNPSSAPLCKRLDVPINHIS